MRKICIIGSVGRGEKTSSGQIIRTRILEKSLMEHYGESNVIMINTSQYLKYAVRIIALTIYSLFCCDVYIVILSGNGRKVFFPILALLKKLFGKKVLNNIIGGDYASSVEKYPRYIKYSNAYDVNWVQMPSIKESVTKLGINKVEVLPNSKPLKIIDACQNGSNRSSSYRFCTFSRVSKAKGIELAIKAVENINKTKGYKVADLTIYGKPDEDYKETFESIMENATEAIHYGGVVDFDKTTDVLCSFYMLLFPTTFYGEGFPGTVLDAFASALPILASSWKFNSELIEDGCTGLIYDYREPEQLEKKLVWSIDHPDEVSKMREKCIQEARKYMPENVMPIIYEKIDALRNRR